MAETSDVSVSVPPEWDVLRDDDGNPVTITVKQMQAIWRAISVVEQVRAYESYPSMWKNPNADLGKSRLLGRMLIDGRPPLAEKPPSYLSARAYHAVEPDLPHYYLGCVFPVVIQGGTAKVDEETMQSWVEED